MRQRDWGALQGLLSGPLTPERKEAVLAALRLHRSEDQIAVSRVARTLIRRLDVGAAYAVTDLALWVDAPQDLQRRRTDAWARLSAGHRGDSVAIRASPVLWRDLVEHPDFLGLARQARAVALIEAAQAHWRAGRFDGDHELMAQAVDLGLRAADAGRELPHAGEAFTVAADSALNLWRESAAEGDLEVAHRYAVLALEATPPTLPRLGWRRARLAEKLMQLSNWHGTLAPVEEALGLLVDAPAATADMEDRSVVFHDLSRALARRWQIARDPADLELSVDAARSAVGAMPAGSPERRYVVSVLASVLQRRGLALDDLNDLDEALVVRRQLVEEEVEKPRLTLVKGNLARSLRAIGERRGRPELLEEAADLMAEAVAETSPGHSDFPKRLHDLGRTHRARGGADGAKAARGCFEKALEVSTGRPEVEALVAADLGQVLEGEDRLCEAARAFDRSLRAVSELQGREARMRDRIDQLGRLQDLVAMAARAALLGCSSQAALDTIDRGRAIVMSDALDATMSLSGRDFEAGLLCVGAAPGGGFALLTADNGVATQICPDLTSAAVEAKAAELETALVERGRDPDAFARAVDGIAEWLGEALRLDGLNLPPRLSLVSLGGLGRLPVHLAKRQGRELCIDHVITVRLRLRKGSHRAAVAFRRGVFIAPESRGMRPLVLAGQERRAMSLALKSVETIRGPEATTDYVLASLGRTDVLHVAGHAESLPSRPLESRIFLSGDEVLSVADLLASSVGGNVELVVLTGCETADIGARAPDEVVGLPAGMIVAGAQTVISSHWPVSQVGAALISHFFYEAWSKHKAEPAHALAIAQQRMALSSAEELAAVAAGLDAPVTDADRLRQAVHWGAWTCTSV